MSNQTLHVAKYHALGNSYIILDPRRLCADDRLFDTAASDLRPREHVVRTLCDGTPANIRAVALSGSATKIFEGEFNLASLQP